MFIAINRFKIKLGQGASLEEGFAKKGGLEQVPGFVGFELQKRVWNMGKPEENDEYLSVSRWESKEAFLAWTRSEAFRKAHGGPKNDAILSGHPSGYEVVAVRKPEK